MFFFRLVATPTFFLTRPEEAKFLPADLAATGVICENLTYLGPCGVREVAGLQVAFYNGAQPDALFNALLSRTRSAAFRGVDVFLTNHWSQGVLSNLKDLTIPGIATTELSAFGNAQVAELAEVLTPRYHFAASPGHVYFERAPYCNIGQERPVTRFLGLSEAFNARKAKFMYAFQIAPKTAADLTSTGATPSPFEHQRLLLEEERREQQNNAKKRKFDEMEKEDKKTGTQLFFDDKRAQRGQQYHERQARADISHPSSSSAGTEETHYQDRKRTHQDRMSSEEKNGGQYKSRRSGPRTEYSRSRFDRNDPNMQKKIHPLMQRGGCWFCLSNPSVEEHMVISVGDHYYLALAKGGLNNHHVLIIPIEHSPTIHLPSDAAKAELNRFKEALVSCFNKHGLDAIFFERKQDISPTHGSDKNHAHMQVLALSKETMKAAKLRFDSHLEHFGLIFTEVQTDQLASLVSGQSGYLYLDIPDTSEQMEVTQTESAPSTAASPSKRHQLLAIVPDKKHVPLQLPRRAIAEAMQEPGREDWKQCALSKNDEEQACSDFKEEFGAFDFTLQ